MGISLGFLTRSTPMSELLDRSFIEDAVEPAQIDLSRMPEILKTINLKP